MLIMLITHAYILYSLGFFLCRSENYASKSKDLLHIAQIYDLLICCPDRGSQACTCIAKPTDCPNPYVEANIHK